MSIYYMWALFAAEKSETFNCLAHLPVKYTWQSRGLTLALITFKNGKETWVLFVYMLFTMA